MTNSALHCSLSHVFTGSLAVTGALTGLATGCSSQAPSMRPHATVRVPHVPQDPTPPREMDTMRIWEMDHVSEHQRESGGRISGHACFIKMKLIAIKPVYFRSHYFAPPSSTQAPTPAPSRQPVTPAPPPQQPTPAIPQAMEEPEPTIYWCPFDNWYTREPKPQPKLEKGKPVKISVAARPDFLKSITPAVIVTQNPDGSKSLSLKYLGLRELNYLYYEYSQELGDIEPAWQIQDLKMTDMTHDGIPDIAVSLKKAIASAPADDSPMYSLRIFVGKKTTVPYNPSRFRNPQNGRK